MCPPWPPQHVPPWPPQHKPTMGATARATPAPPQAGRHTATAQSGGGAPIVGPLLQQHASALCASGLVGGPAMAATAHHGRHSTPPPWPPGGTPRNGRHSTPTPTGMLPWLPAPWCTVPCTNLGGTMQWLLQHAPHGPTMAATARPHHGCHSTPPAAMAACTWPPWAATWCGQCCPPTPLPWLPKHAPSVGRVGTAALGAQITPFLQTSWCS